MESGESRWAADVIYLSDYPAGTDVSPYGIPHFTCDGCGGRLASISDPAQHGTMFICLYQCGQRYWVDADIRD